MKPPLLPFPRPWKESPAHTPNKSQINEYSDTGHWITWGLWEIIMVADQCSERTGGWLQMNRLSLRSAGWSSRLQRSTNHFRGIYRIHLKWINQNRTMLTCNRIDLESLGSWLTPPKNFPGTVADHPHPLSSHRCIEEKSCVEAHIAFPTIRILHPTPRQSKAAFRGDFWSWSVKNLPGTLLWIINACWQLSAFLYDMHWGIFSKLL